MGIIAQNMPQISNYLLSSTKSMVAPTNGNQGKQWRIFKVLRPSTTYNWYNNSKYALNSDWVMVPTTANQIVAINIKLTQIT